MAVASGAAVALGVAAAVGAAEGEGVTSDGVGRGVTVAAAATGVMAGSGVLLMPMATTCSAGEAQPVNIHNVVIMIKSLLFILHILPHGSGYCKKNILPCRGLVKRISSYA